MEVFEEYLASLKTPEHRVRMEEIFKWIKSTFPTLMPIIKWKQPMFTDHDTFIIGFSAAKNHMSVAPEQAGMNHVLEDIEQAGHDHTKELVRFKWKEPVDYKLLEKMIQFNILDKADCSTFWRK
ncbi:iron chaperone [Cytobacillus gottheilii]|uniref:iron chaperone n=1 Tax=Cytobacillus gottheilii TaxID=859144 RepID=UPI00083662F2|nr:iron chaperone [Cytobacillus gottheilii]